jgi:hypothetical protein
MYTITVNYMTVYISHASGFDYKKELYEPIRSSILDKQYNFILPHETSASLYNPKQLFTSKKCDLVIAECSYPSTGQGIELGWANIYKIPIVCIYREGKVFSNSLISVCDTFISYKDSRDMIGKIEEVVKKYV